MAKLTIKIEYDSEDNKGINKASDMYYRDVEMTFDLPGSMHRQTFLKPYAAFMYYVYGYSVKELEEIIEL